MKKSVGWKEGKGRDSEEVSRMERGREETVKKSVGWKREGRGKRSVGKREGRDSEEVSRMERGREETVKR